MTFQTGGNLSGGRVSAGGGRGGLVIGGGLGTIALVLVAVFFGVDPQAILPAIQGSEGSQQNAAAVQDLQNRIDRCKKSDSAAANEDPVCRIVATTISVDAIWGGTAPPPNGYAISTSQHRHLRSSCEYRLWYGKC